MVLEHSRVQNFMQTFTRRSRTDLYCEVTGQLRVVFGKISLEHGHGVMRSLDVCEHLLQSASELVPALCLELTQQ